ncbi:MAG: DNA-processing protein DprA [Oscillospiraceae bacterium]|nr:DNA-processing protein DprA [Oscillospiraceae bacterium]
MEHLLKYWIWLSMLKGIGAVTALRLLNHFGCPEKVFMADQAQYFQVEQITLDDIQQLCNKNLDNANKILADCAQIGCHIITYHDKQYPNRLKNIYDPPILLYVRGKLNMIDEEPVVGIVGTRDCTPYGLNAAETIGYDLSNRGVTVATGLAKGIDSAAARGALMGGGRVVGIIGSGLSIVYPPENKQLFEDVAMHGAIISEYPPKTAAIKSHFPMRNRLIAGVSLGVAVIEAPRRSGALITALQALEQGRDVFTLPGNIDAKSCAGSNALLRDGAIAMLSAEDIIGEYIALFPNKISKSAEKIKPHVNAKRAEIGFGAALDTQRNKSLDVKKEIDKKLALEYIDLDTIISKLSGDEKTIAEMMKSRKLHIDEIIQKANLSAPNVLTALTMLEIKGHVLQESGKIFSLSSVK